MQERLNLLRIIDVVKKIETENRYLQKVERIEKVRQDKDSRSKELLDYAKALQQKRLSRTIQNRQFQEKEFKKKTKDLASVLRKNEETQASKQEEAACAKAADRESVYELRRM